MVSAASMKRAHELLDFADSATDDPRRTRIDLVQVANKIAQRARQDESLRELVGLASRFLEGQTISSETLEQATKTGHGWPAPLRAAERGPASYYHSAMRLLMHAALRQIASTSDFEERTRDVTAWRQRLERALDVWDDDWAEALTLAAAERAATPGDFRRRLVAAAWDVGLLVDSDELPTWADFVDGPTGPIWPPLVLGVPPVQGAMDDEERFDGGGWGDAAGGGTAAAVVACAGGFFATGHYAEGFLCILGVVALLAIVLIIAAA